MYQKYTKKINNDIYIAFLDGSWYEISKNGTVIDYGNTDITTAEKVLKVWSNNNIK